MLESTLLMYGPVVWLMPFMRDKVPWDPVKDFAPVTLATESPNILVIHPSLPVKSVPDLIALAKARPGQLNYGSGLTGASNHLAAELFMSLAHINMVRVVYKSTGPALNALIGGEVQVLFPAAGGGIAPHIRSGRLRALAVTSAEPSELAPGLPTVAASGVPGYESGIISALLAPAKTPAAIVNRLNQETVRVLNKPEIKERLLGAGFESIASSPEQLAAKIKSEMERLGKVIKQAGIRDE